jgi:hypothetical protein
MFRIARLRLAGVGPADARFDKPSPESQPFEVSCLGASGEPEDSVIWLENGGGKTVFLSLLFHVLRPDKAAQIGNDDQGGRRADISDFVLAGDVAHVAIEWVAEDNDERIIMGLVAERKGTGVNRTWYLLAVREGAISLDDLAFDLEGRRVPATRFVESLEQLASKAGKSGRRNRVELTKTSVQRTWFEMLGDHDLDPALFEYQVRMNRSEGGATSLFRFPSAERFVEFFLQLTMNPDTVTAVSDELSRVAEKVASLPRKELELAHAAGAVDRLGRLATAWSTFETADKNRTIAQRSAEGLYDQLTSALGRASETLANAEVRLGGAEADRVAADKARREADTRAKTVAVALGDARVAAITTELATEDLVSKEAALIVSAWPRVTQYQRRVALDGQIGEIRLALQSAEREAEPLRERRDGRLRALRRQLEALASSAEGAMDVAAEEAVEWGTAELAAEDALRGLEGRINEIRGLLVGLTAQVERHERAVEEAVASDLMSRGADVSSTLNMGRNDLIGLADELQRTGDSRRALAAELPDLRKKVRESDEAAGQAEREHIAQRELVAAAQEERRQLTSDSTLAELGAEDVDIEIVGADIVVRLSAEADRQRASAIAAEAAAAEDRRATDSLERDRLLPARAEVDLLCGTLRAGGVPSATPGWRYLVDAVPAGSHAAVIAAHPSVVDGIVVAAHDLDHARELLADAAPSAAILIATGATLTESDLTLAEGWVVPPAAAIHDRGSAEPELERRRERLTTASELAASIAATERRIRRQAEGLDAHLVRWPTGTLPAAVALMDERERAARTTRDAATDDTNTLHAAETLLTETDSALENLRQRHSRADRRVRSLERLAELATEADAASAQTAQLVTERSALTAEAKEKIGRRDAAHQAAAGANRRMATAERARDGANQQIAALPDPGEGAEIDTESVDVVQLRAAYESAAQLVSQVTTDSELARRLADLERERQTVESEWQAIAAELRARIEELAGSPAAADPISRRVAEDTASKAAGEAAETLAQTRSRLEVAKANRGGLPDPEPTWPVAPFPIPSNIVALEALSSELDMANEAARERRSEAHEAFSAERVACDHAEAARAALDVQAISLSHMIGERDPLPAIPFEGDAAAAVKGALRRISDASGAREAADAAWRREAHAVGVFARDDRWNALLGELARRIRDDEPEMLARASGELLTQTRILESRLRDDISHLDVHRQMLVNSLGDSVSEAARSLRSARKKSELPAGLGDWSHQPFLKIGLDFTSDRAELDGRLRRFTNDILERSASGGSSLPMGADLICQAVLACADKSVSVEVLKPNKAQRLRYVPITDTATLSGGMRATAAIAMFCTLAKVRAANRTGRVGVGALVLDNPLGDANATYLVALQRLVAQMNGVQLIYTTGVNDMDALRLFPVVTRLTNETAKRSHLAYVVADEAFLKRLQPAGGDNAIISGTRLVRTQPPLLAADLAAMSGEEDSR